MYPQSFQAVGHGDFCRNFRVRCVLGPSNRNRSKVSADQIDQGLGAESYIFEEGTGVWACRLTEGDVQSGAEATFPITGIATWKRRSQRTLRERNR